MDNIHKEALEMAESHLAMYQNSVNALEGWFRSLPTGTHYDDLADDRKRELEEYRKKARIYKHIVEVLKAKE